MFEQKIGAVRTVSWLLSALGSLALLMASVGIYAILAYAVSQRTHEIGIRIALGAQRLEIMTLIMRRTVVLIAWGTGVGLPGGAGLEPGLGKSFWPTWRTRRRHLRVRGSLLGAAALIASDLPARNALRADPVQALRCE